MITIIEPHENGWLISLKGEPYLYAYPGSTGPCWHIREADDEGADFLHVCELDDLIAALQALKASDAHRVNVERWQ